MPIPDRQKQRREYLMKMAGAISKSIGRRIVAVCIFAPAAFLGIAAVILVLMAHYVWFFGQAVTSTSLNSAAIIFSGLASVFGYAYWRIRPWVLVADLEASVIPYIPPFILDTLPAEEILVRSSQEPEQEQSAVLLRAAESADTPAEELLRASIGEQREA